MNDKTSIFTQRLGNKRKIKTNLSGEKIIRKVTRETTGEILETMCNASMIVKVNKRDEKIRRE